MASSFSSFSSAFPGSSVPAFERAKLHERLTAVLGRFQNDLAATPGLSEQNIQSLYIDGPGGSLLTALGWPVDVPTLYRQNISLSTSTKAGLRPDGLLARPAPNPTSNPAPVNLIAMDAKKPALSELPHFEPGERLNLDKLKTGGSNLYNKIRYCDYGPDAPRWLLLTCTDRLYLYDSVVKRWVIALNSAADMTTEEGLDRLAMLAWPALTVENANELKGLARRYDRKPLEEQLEDELREWRKRLAEMLYGRNASNPALASPETGLFDPQRLQRAVQRVLDRLLLVQILQDKGFVNDLVQNDLDVLQNVLAVRESYAGLTGLTLQVPPLYELLRRGVFEQFANRYGSAIFEPHLCDDLDYGIPGSSDENGLAEVMKGVMQFSFREFDSRRLGTVYERYAGFRIDFEPGPTGVMRAVSREDMRFRKQSGTYYTPDYIVEYIVRHTLGQTLTNQTPAGIAGLRVLDPACGSGTFLIGAFDELAEFYHGWYSRWLQAGLDGTVGPDFEGLGELVAHYPRRILERHLYGVDLNPEAAEFATVSLLLRALEWEKAHDLLPAPGTILPAGTPPVEPLPLILNQNIKVGNSLISGLPSLNDPTAVTAALAPWRPEIELILQRRQTLCDRADLDRAERLRLLDEIAALAERVNYGSVAPGRPGAAAIPSGPTRPGLNLPLAAYFGGNSEGVRDKSPFNWPVEFPEVFPTMLTADPTAEVTTTSQQNGFDCVIGNPPYIGFQGFDQEKEYLKKLYISAHGKFDIYLPFIEQGIKLLAKTKVLGYICPTNFMKRGHGEQLRDYLLKNTEIVRLHDYEDIQIFDDATNYTGLFIFRKIKSKQTHNIFFSSGNDLTKTVDYPQEKLSKNTWVFTFGDRQRIVDAITKTSTYELKEITSSISEGIVTGQNQVFLLTANQYSILGLESDIVLPIARGEQVKRWRTLKNDYYLIYPYITDKVGKTKVIEEIELEAKYPKTYKYLLSRRKDLEGRDYFSKSPKRWYELWNQRDVQVQRAKKIIVPENSDRNNFIYEDGNFLYIDTVCGLIFIDGLKTSIYYFLAVLNSNLIEYYYKKTTVPKANGFFIYKTMFLKDIPIRKIEFTTDPDERADRLAEAKSRWAGEGGPATLVSLAAEELAAGRSDVVHDVLAWLAEEMTELTRQRRALVTEFDRWVEGYERKLKLGLWVNGLPPNRLKVLQGVAQKKQIELRRLEARPTTAIQVDGPGAAALSVWLTYRVAGSKTDVTEEIYRVVLPAALAEFVRYSLPKEGGFKTDKKLESWLLANESIVLRDVPGAVLPSILENYRATLAEAARLDGLLAATDATIDAIVYDLYGLDAAERAIIEGA